MVEMKGKPMHNVTALTILAGVEFKPFDDMDWNMFSGCQTENPLIGETDSYIIVIDGNRADFYPSDPDTPEMSYVFENLAQYPKEWQ